MKVYFDDLVWDNIMSFLRMPELPESPHPSATALREVLTGAPGSAVFRRCNSCGEGIGWIFSRTCVIVRTSADRGPYWSCSLCVSVGPSLI